MSRRVVKVSVISDFSCPFCYIGHKELMDALQHSQDLPVEFDVEYRPFNLITTLAEGESIDKKLYYVNKCGGAAHQAEKLKVIRTWGEKIGIDMKFGGVISESSRAHRLSLKAYHLGGQDLQLPILTALFHSHCTLNQDIGNYEVLAQIADDVGMMSKDEALTFLESDELKSEVANYMSAARTGGVKGVPVTVVQGKWAIEGAQKAECFSSIFKKLASNSESAPGTPIPGPICQTSAAVKPCPI
jgi:predicted DsbA family dithiol-disulfide isomerase